jgi:hypothetical protein
MLVGEKQRPYQRRNVRITFSLLCFRYPAAGGVPNSGRGIVKNTDSPEAKAGRPATFTSGAE